jgi:predicted phosphodiesterase
MRYGVLADIHANLPALDAVLAELERRDVDRYIVAGDVVGYGPQPNECARVVAELGAACVAGNHDLIALGRLSDERCIPLARQSLRWTAGALTSETRDFLGNLPTRRQVDGQVDVAHGSLDDPQEYTRDVERGLRQLARLEAERGHSALLVLGHTHRPFGCALPRGRLRVEDGTVLALPADEPVLLNPGAVGQSRELRARARCMVLDVEKREALFLDVPYDIRACRRSLRDVGLSAHSCHLRPSPMRAAGRAARRVREHVAGAWSANSQATRKRMHDGI